MFCHIAKWKRKLEYHQIFDNETFSFFESWLYYWITQLKNTCNSIKEKKIHVKYKFWHDKLHSEINKSLKSSDSCILKFCSSFPIPLHSPNKGSFLRINDNGVLFLFFLPEENRMTFRIFKGKSVTKELISSKTNSHVQRV